MRCLATLPLLTVLLSSLPLHAEEPVHSLTLSLAGNLYQTAAGSGSKLQPNMDLRHDTAFGSLFVQQGEAGIGLPAPGGWVTLAAANESQWELGANSSHWMGVLRYGVDLPQDGSLSIGYADRLGNSTPGSLLVMNLDLTLGHWRNQRVSLLGWASLADSQRATSLGHQADGNGRHLEQSNLLLMLNHPFNPRWSMDIGAGSRWMADSARQHSAGWQTVFSLNCKLY